MALRECVNALEMRKITFSSQECNQDSLSIQSPVSWQCSRILCYPAVFLTPWSTDLLKKLTGLQPIKKFPTFYETQMFITAFTSARYLSLSWTSSIQTIPLHSTSWSSILILSYLRLGLPSGLFPLRFPHQISVYASPLPHTRYIPRPSHSSSCSSSKKLRIVRWMYRVAISTCPLIALLFFSSFFSCF
jgi:hypothetical protein